MAGAEKVRQRGVFNEDVIRGYFMIGLLVFFFLSGAYAEHYVVVNGQPLVIPEI